MERPKAASNSRFGYSEEDMARGFHRLLQSRNGAPGVGGFDEIYREISCRQGRPDFIALRYPLGSGMKVQAGVFGLVGPSILNLLKPTASRTLEYIISRSEFGCQSIRRSLRQLIDSEHVEQNDKGAYRLGKASKCPNVEIWSFELKLSNPKRAVFQAQQNRTFAERAIIVVPPGQENSYDRFRETMRRWDIGLATFDLGTDRFRFVRKGRRARALSRTYQIYALAQIGLARGKDAAPTQSEVDPSSLVSR